MNSREAAQPHDIVYGEVRKGGAVTYLESTGTDNLYLHMVVALAGHEVEEIGDIYINDQIVALDGNGFVMTAPYTNWIRIKKHLGGPEQVVDPDLLAESEQIDSSFVGAGIAYIYVRLHFNQDVFPNGVPLFTAKVKGRKVYDPRSLTTAYSRNAALCIRDFITSDLGLNDAAVNDTVLSVAANVSDEDVPLAAGGIEKRYEINGVIEADQTRGQVLQEMMTACGGSLFWGQGKWQLKPGYWTPPLKNFTLDDLRGPISLQTRLERRENFNAVSGTFNDAAQDYVLADFPLLQSETFRNEDGGEQNTLDLQLSLTTSDTAAQRLSRQVLFRAREQIAPAASFGMSAFDVQVGDVISMTIEKYGWNNKPFEVQSWSFSINSDELTLGVNLGLRETSQAAYDWNANERAILRNNTSLLPFNTVPGVGLSVRAETQIYSERVTIAFRIEVTSDNPGYVDRVEVQIKKETDANWQTIGIGPLGLFVQRDLEPGSYQVRARAVSSHGVRGDWFTLDGNEVADLSDVPPNVSGLFSQIFGRQIRLQWVPVDDGDLSHYVVRHAVELAGASWADATTADARVARPGSSVVLPAEPGTYMVRAISKRGLVSPDVASVVLTANEIQSFGVATSSDQHPTFSGTKTGCMVSASRLVITDTSIAGSADYDFDGYIDTGAVQRACVKCSAKIIRSDTTGGLFDEAPGFFDDSPGLFDDTDSDFADVNVLFFVSFTNDNPLGSPVWSDWRQIRASEVYGRAFRFRARLITQSVGVTPSIEELSATLEV
ncbi:MAG: phage tail protein [Pseudomonadota bacterium]